MKIKNLFFLATLGLLVSGACAAQLPLAADIIVLPTYVVSAPRYLPFEKQMKANLREICLRAHTPLAVTMELPLSKVQTHPAKLALNHAAAKPAHDVRS